MKGERLPDEQWRRKVVLDAIRRAQRASARRRELRLEPAPEKFDFSAQATYDPDRQPGAFYYLHDTDPATEDADAIALHLSRQHDTEGARTNTEEAQP